MVYTANEPQENQINPLQRILSLDERLKRYQYAYYVKSQQPISDIVFDALFRELEELHGQFPEYDHLETVVTKPMPYVDEAFTLVEHIRPMQSIQTIMADEPDKLKKFVRDIVANYAEPSFLVELKYDGLAISLIYKDGVLVRALTRGSNNKGELVTHTVAMLQDVPLKLNVELKGITEIRGEITMKKGSLEKINQLLPIGKGFSSLRNAASGLIRRNKLIPELAKFLQFHAYDCFVDEQYGDRHYKKQSAKLTFMGILGFKDCGKYKVTNAMSFSDIKQTYETVSRYRDTYPFEIDGIVIKVDDFSIQDKLGIGSRVQNWSRAFKFDAVVKKSIVNKIDVTVGATGQLTPVVYIEPVEINGVAVSKASVSNFKKLNALNISVGTEVMIKRSGDTIPEIVESLSNKPSRYVVPLHCPYCGSVIEGDLEGNRYCSGTMVCPKQALGRIQRFFNKDNVKIDGISDQTLEFLFENKMISEPIDLFCIGLRKSIGDYAMTKGQFGFGPDKVRAIATDNLSFNGLMSERAIKTLLKNIKAVKPVKLHQVIAGLGIKHVSTERAKTIASHYRTLDNFLTATQEGLVQMEGINAATATSIMNFLSQSKAQELLLLPSLGLTIVPEVEMDVSKFPLHGKAYVFTGTLSVRRDHYEQRLVTLGAKIHKTVMQSTTALIYGEGPGPKLDLACKLGVPRLNEKALEQLLKDMPQ